MELKVFLITEFSLLPPYNQVKRTPGGFWEAVRRSHPLVFHRQAARTSGTERVMRSGGTGNENERRDGGTGGEDRRREKRRGEASEECVCVCVRIVVGLVVDIDVGVSTQPTAAPWR